MNRTHRHIDALQHDYRELERLARVLREEGLPDAAEHLDDAAFTLIGYIEDIEAQLATQTPEQRLRDLLG